MKRLKIGSLLAAGLLALLAGCNYLIDSSDPSVSITNPSGGTISPQNTTITVTASDDDSGIASITLLLNGSEIKTETFEKDEEGRYSLAPKVLTHDWNVSATGEYTLTAVARNGFGKTAETERTVNVTKPADPDSPDEANPTVEWITPTADGNYSGVIDLAVAANDDKGVVRVEFYAGNQLLATDAEAPYNYAWDTEDENVGREDGPVTLSAKAYDAVGRIGEEGLSITLLNSGIPPMLSIVSPNDGGKIGATFDVVAEVTSGGEDYSWQLMEGHKLWVYIYDYRGELVAKDFLTTNGTGNAADEPQDNVDFVGRASFDLGDIPTDSYTVAVEGTVVVNGVEVRVGRSNGVTGVIESTLPPALLVFTPAPPEAGATARVGDVVNVAGRITDQTEDIETVEVRMVCDSCGAGGKPENKLLYYNSELEYDLFATGVIALDGSPYVFDSDQWKLRVVGIDKGDAGTRNIREFNVIVDRTADYSELANALNPSDPDGNGPLEPNFSVDVVEDTAREVTPASATWIINTSGLSNPVKYLLVTRFNGEVVAFNKGTVDGANTLTVNRTFGDADVGTWQVEGIFQDTVTGVQYSDVGPAVGVTKNSD